MSLRKLDSYIIVLLVGLALLIRLPLLGASFWLDEAAQALEVTRPWHQQLLIAPDFQPPLLHLLLHLAQYVGTSEIWLRTIGALIPGLISIYFALKLGRNYLSVNQLTWFGLLLATSQLHVFFSQELRPYALPAAFASLSWWYLDRILRAPKVTTQKARPLLTNSRASSPTTKQTLTFGLITALGLFSSYLYPFLVLSQLFFLSYRRQLKLLLPGFLLAGLLFAPWLPWFYEQLQVGGQLRQALPGWDQVVSTPQLKALLLVPGKFLFGQVPLTPTYTGVTLLLSSVIGTLAISQFALRHPLQMVLRTKVWPFLEKFLVPKDSRTIFQLALFWLLVPFITSWLISWWVPVVSPKRLLFSLPAFYLIPVSFQYLRARRLLWHWLMATLLLINIFGLTSYWSDTSLQREDWRSLVAQMHQGYSADETMVIFGFEAPFSPFAWYEGAQSEPLPTLSTGYLTNDEAKVQIKTTLESAGSYRYLLVFDYLRDLTDPDNLIPSTLNEMGYQEVGVLERPGIGFVRIFTIKSARIGTL